MIDQKSTDFRKFQSITITQESHRKSISHLRPTRSFPSALRAFTWIEELATATAAAVAAAAGNGGCVLAPLRALARVARAPAHVPSRARAPSPFPVPARVPAPGALGPDVRDRGPPRVRGRGVPARVLALGRAGSRARAGYCIGPGRGLGRGRVCRGSRRCRLDGTVGSSNRIDVANPA